MGNDGPSEGRPQSKLCNACGEVKDLSAFRMRRRGMRLYPESRCKACRAARHREYYRRNPRRTYKTNRRWVEAHREKVRAYGRRAYHKNKDTPKYKAYRAAYSAANRERIHAYQRKWREFRELRRDVERLEVAIAWMGDL